MRRKSTALAAAASTPIARDKVKLPTSFFSALFSVANERFPKLSRLHGE
jgi:hypothetical protein